MDEKRFLIDTSHRQLLLNDRPRKKERQFYFLYSAAWLIYAASLGAVFLGFGNPFDVNLFLNILCNVAPAFLLGILVIGISRKLKWNDRRRPQFAFLHLLSSIIYSVSWCFLTLFDLSVLVYLQRGTWSFVSWNSAALQWQIFSGFMAYLTIASAAYVKQINENLQLEERRNAELQIRAVRAEAARASAELAALRTQLNPHFLFNTLHSLMALVRTDAKIAEEAIERFSLMLRYVLQSQNEKQSAPIDADFGDEWNFIQNYLELERLRLGDRLKLITEIDPAAFEYKFPAFSVQPLVENAIKHSIALRADGGTLHVSAQTENGNLVIIIRDDGNQNPISAANENGSGLRLVRESLAARFGGEASLTTNSTERGFEATIKIPHPNSLDDSLLNDSNL